MAKMSAESGAAPEKRYVVHTPCCGDGAYPTEFGVYLVMSPKCPKPTQTAERVGVFRGCSKCCRPLGDVKFRPGWEVPHSVWMQMLERVGQRGQEGPYGCTAYWAQREPDGEINLYDWKSNPTVQQMNLRRANIGKMIDHQNKMPIPESMEKKINRQIAQAKERGLFDGHDAKHDTGRMEAPATEATKPAAAEEPDESPFDETLEKYPYGD